MLTLVFMLATVGVASALTALYRQNRIIGNLEAIMTKSEEVQQEINELTEAVDLIGNGVTGLKTTLATASQRIAELEAEGVSPEVVSNLRTAVDSAQVLASQFEAAVDPEQTTPAPEELPEPVTPETPAEEPTPLGNDDLPADNQAPTESE